MDVNGTYPQAGTQPGTQPGTQTGTQPYAQAYGYPAIPVPVKLPKRENLFKPEIADLVFALVAFVLGYVFSRWVLFWWLGWGVTAFTAVYLFSVTIYLIKKNVFRQGLATWFWFAVTMTIGASYALWENAGFAFVKALFLFCSATYYLIIASGNPIMGKTGNYLLIDGFNAVIIVPFRNFFNQYVSFSAIGKDDHWKKKGFSVFIGVVLTIILAAILIPLLERADSGGFGIVLRFIADIFDFINLEFILYAVLAVPIAAYLYGLASGVAHKKGLNVIRCEAVERAVPKLRFLQQMTIIIVLSAVCALYLIFILSQIPYFFSAFTGERPEGWLLYSQYARHGFFELCSIAAINLIILLACNVTCKKHRLESSILKVFNILLSLITLVLIATAFSKMALYIDAFGLTMPRLMPCVFMVFLAAVFIALIVMQKLSFSIVRFALVTGAIIMCVLSAVNPDAMVVRYNTNRYLSGTLLQYDTEILYRAGSAGVLPAIRVYNETRDQDLKEEIRWYLIINYGLHKHAPHSYSLESLTSQQALAAGGFTPIIPDVSEAKALS